MRNGREQGLGRGMGGSSRRAELGGRLSGQEAVTMAVGTVTGGRWAKFNGGWAVPEGSRASFPCGRCARVRVDCHRGGTL